MSYDTRARFGSGLGALLTNFAGGVENARSRQMQQAQMANDQAYRQGMLQNQATQLEYQDPYRQPSQLELLTLASKGAPDPMQQIGAQINANLMGVPYQPQPFNMMERFKQLQQILNNQGQPQQPVQLQQPVQPPQQPSTPAPVSRGGANLQAIADEMRKRGLFQ